MSEANVEITRRHYEIRHGEGGKRREIGAFDRAESTRGRGSRSYGDGGRSAVLHHRRIVARTAVVE
jgi:hypothetical protein